MKCPNCGAEIKDGALYCPECGANTTVPGSGSNAANQNNGAQMNNGAQPNDGAAQNNGAPMGYEQRYQQGMQQQGMQQGMPQQNGPQQYYGGQVQQIPAEYTPISMWGYFGYELLFSIPIVGFIFLCIYAFGGTANKNLKNFARSYFCLFIIVLALVIILLVLGVGAGLSAAMY